MEIVLCDCDSWDDFVSASPTATIFNRSVFLKSYGFKTRYITCTDHGSPIGGIGLILQGDNPIHPMDAYTGLVITPDKNKLYRQNQLIFEATSCLAEYLFNTYSDVFFSNSPSIIDMRPFQWLNYHTPEAGYYSISTRYTSEISFKDFSNRLNWAGGRKNDIVRARKFLARSFVSNDSSTLAKLYSATFQRQGIVLEEPTLQQIQSQCDAILRIGAGLLVITEISDEPASASFFCVDKRKAYFLTAGTNPKFRNTGVGTKNLFDAIFLVHETFGTEFFDLVGVNSPNRGAFKLSFGGTLVPYYTVRKVSPQHRFGGTGLSS